jgi:acid phosphatase class B
MNQFAKVSFDFDDTLAKERSIGSYGGTVLVCIPKFVQLLKEYHALGCKCIILTARTYKKEDTEIEEFLKYHEIDHAISDIVYTAQQAKGSFAKELGVNLHYDDSDYHLDSVRSFGIQVVSSVKKTSFI